jgi:hypothetical protein
LFCFGAKITKLKRSEKFTAKKNGKNAKKCEKMRKIAKKVKKALKSEKIDLNFA